MTRDDIIKLAREAGISESHAQGMQRFLDAFAALVAAAEREACARVCEEMRHPYGYSAETQDWVGATDNCAAAIRARGQK